MRCGSMPEWRASSMAALRMPSALAAHGETRHVDRRDHHLGGEGLNLMFRTGSRLTTTILAFWSEGAFMKAFVDASRSVRPIANAERRARENGNPSG